MQVIGEVQCDHDSGGGGVDAHVISGVVEELGTGITLHIMGIIVTPAQLHIYPILLSGGGVHHVPKHRQHRLAWHNKVERRDGMCVCV